MFLAADFLDSFTTTASPAESTALPGLNSSTAEESGVPGSNSSVLPCAVADLVGDVVWRFEISRAAPRADSDVLTGASSRCGSCALLADCFATADLSGLLTPDFVFS